MLVKSSYKDDIDGVLLFDKPVGDTSNAVLQKIKHLLNAKKAGHAGTLDPLASGLLPICFGEATKFARYTLNHDKRYQVTAKLGQCTTTCDAEGDIIATSSADHINSKLLYSALTHFTGEILQIPSMYSALKHHGTPLYKLARNGIEVERQPRKITIYKLELLAWQDNLIELDVLCSKGTYIRNLVDDIGKFLNCGAYVTSLRRIEVGLYKNFKMYTLEELLELKKQSATALKNILLPIDSGLSELTKINITSLQAQDLYYGKTISLNENNFYNDICISRKLGSCEQLVRLYNANIFIGAAQIVDDKIIAQRLLSRLPTSIYDSIENSQ